MRSRARVIALVAASAMALPLLAACGGSGGAAANDASSDLTKGPISIWYSTNEQEITWSKQVVKDWNAAHPDEKATAQAIPAGSSSEDVIAAAITAGNAPCLVLGASPSSTPASQKQGGLVDLSKTFPDADKYISNRSGKATDGFRSSDGDLYQMPWKTNPMMLYYNKDEFQKAGLDPNNPQLSTYDDVLAASKAIKDSGAAQVAIYPPATSDYTNMNYDFYPFYLANSGGTPFIKDGKATFTSEAGMQTLQFWQTMYADGYASNEAYSGDMWGGPFADGVAAMGVAGPWGMAQFNGKVNYGIVPLPTATGKSADQTYTFADSKSIAMYTSCKNKQSAWDFAKFATSDKNDLALIETTGQFPVRGDVTTLASDYLAKNPDLQPFAASVPLAVDVPNVANLTTKMQDFRDAWSSTVETGKGDLKSTFDKVAKTIDTGGSSS